ncbi:unnamed protein product [Oikopleura dioica]|uniref:J domain-containing protein n=1 Tax=Oikopleura dioica TaxID=34765 RepID=E4Y2E0_OIKDI|nr:unnamed protein product [Oikopleura dioica]
MTDSTKCFYEILGISQEAEDDEIQAAFEASKQAFEASKTAFDVLNDPKKRGAYDRQKAKENEKELKKKEGQERDVDDKCNEQIIGHFPAKVNFSFDILEKLEERNLLHIRDRIFGALDDRDINNCSQVSKSWQNFMKTNRHMITKKLKMEMGEIGGAGHFWGNDKRTKDGGERDDMREKELENVTRLLAAGQKKVNLKEREFRAFLSEKKNGKKLKKSFGLMTIVRSPRLDGRSSSRLLLKIMEEMAIITISGFQIKKVAPNSKRRRKKLVVLLEKRRTDASCKAKRTGRDN